MDTNGDGKLDKTEIKNGFSEFYKMNLTEEEVEEMMDKVDADGSGEIEYSEFVICTLDQKNFLTAENL